MKKVTLLLNYSELQALYEVLKVYQFKMADDLTIMAWFIMLKVFQRILTRVINHVNNQKKDIKFSLKIAEAVALRLVLVDVYKTSTNDYTLNVSLRITSSINQQLS